MKKALTERQAARRDRVIQAAIELAAEGGYDAVQMRDVATRARVALGTVYRYFSSKDQLLISALGVWAGELERRFAQRPPTGESTADRVVEVLRRATRAMERARTLTSAFVTALGSFSATASEDVESAMEVYETLNRMITVAMRDVDPENRDAMIRVIGHVWFASLVGWVRGWAPTGQMDADLEMTVRLLLEGRATVSDTTAMNGKRRSPRLRI